MTPGEFKRHFAQLQKNIQNTINRDLPAIAGNEAARMFRQNFQQEGFFGKKWQEVKRRQTKTVSYKTKTGKQKTKTVTNGKGVSGRRKILTGRTADLGRSIKVKTEPGIAVIYSDVKYSSAHNYGTSNAGRGNRTRIPQRQFIGDSPELEKAIKTKIESKMNQIFKP